MQNLRTKSRTSAIALAAVMSLGIFAGHLFLVETQSRVELARIRRMSEALQVSLRQLVVNQKSLDFEVRALAAVLSGETAGDPAAARPHMQRIATLAGEQRAMLRAIMHAEIPAPPVRWWQSVRCRSVRAGHSDALTCLQSQLAPLVASNSLLLKVLGNEG